MSQSLTTAPRQSAMQMVRHVNMWNCLREKVCSQPLIGEPTPEFIPRGIDIKATTIQKAAESNRV